MTTNLDIANRALQVMGSRTNMTLAEFNGQTSNEAIQCQLIMFKLRDELNRMAPWDCVKKWASLTYISTLPGNPENPTLGASGSNPTNWSPGQPAIPWSYEYQYPVDCLRVRKILPQFTTQAGGVPIYPASTVTGSGQLGWTGPALKFQVATDQFFGVTAATVAAGGSGYNVGDIIQLVQPVYTFQQNTAPTGQTPNLQSITMNAGAPALLQVATLGGGGAVATVNVVNQINGESTPIGGSYFSVPSNPVAQQFAFLSPGVPSAGTGATFNLTFQTAQQSQRIILCNQTQAIGVYNTLITDPNVMDDLYQDAWIHILGARLSPQLNGEMARANQLIQLTNNSIMEARKADGNEGITVNDVTPDFIRIRGGFGVGPNYEYSPNMDFDWGSYYSPY